MVAKTTENPQREELKQKFVDRLQLECSVSPDEASDKQIYQVSIKPIPSAERTFTICPWNS